MLASEPSSEEHSKEPLAIAGSRSQVSITKMFVWMTLAGFAFASFNAYATQFSSLRGEPILRTSHVIIITLTWIVFLVYYIYERIYVAITVHCLPLVLMLLVLLIFSGDAYLTSANSARSWAPVVTLSAMFCSTVLSIIIGLEATISKAVSNNSKDHHYLLYRIIGGMLLMTVVCGLGPSIQNQFPDGPAMLLGALLGFWIGLYQALASQAWKKYRWIFGVSTRPVVTAGFLGGIALGPVLFSYLNGSIDELVLQYRYSPLVGFATGACMICLYRGFGWTKSKATTEPVELGTSPDSLA